MGQWSPFNGVATGFSSKVCIIHYEILLPNIVKYVKVEYKYIEAKAHIGQQVFEFKVADFVQWGQKNWAYLAWCLQICSVFDNPVVSEFFTNFNIY